MSEPLLKNKSELAHVLGVSRDWILAMQYAGFAMPGGRATVGDALAWLSAHPDFSTTRELKKGRKARREASQTLDDKIRRAVRRFAAEGTKPTA